MHRDRKCDREAAMSTLYKSQIVFHSSSSRRSLFSAGCRCRVGHESKSIEWDIYYNNIHIHISDCLLLQFCPEGVSSSGSGL